MNEYRTKKQTLNFWLNNVDIDEEDEYPQHEELSDTDELVQELEKIGIKRDTEITEYMFDNYIDGIEMYDQAWSDHMHDDEEYDAPQATMHEFLLAIKNRGETPETDSDYINTIIDNFVNENK
jgi:hypothetical protein